MGYHRAGFEVVGVDIKPQPHYPFKFIQVDALTYPLDGFDAIHASPPCQAYSMMQNICKNSLNHPDLIKPIRETLIKTGVPYIIENVYKAPLMASMMLCGTMFGLKIIRHRYFECSPNIFSLMTFCDHSNVYDPWHKDGTNQRVKLSNAMGIGWFMTRPEVREAIPPAYTEWIGKQLIRYLSVSSGVRVG